MQNTNELILLINLFFSLGSSGLLNLNHDDDHLPLFLICSLSQWQNVELKVLRSSSHSNFSSLKRIQKKKGWWEMRGAANIDHGMWTLLSALISTQYWQEWHQALQLYFRVHCKLTPTFPPFKVYSYTHSTSRNESDNEVSRSFRMEETSLWGAHIRFTFYNLRKSLWLLSLIIILIIDISKFNWVTILWDYHMPQEWCLWTLGILENGS